MTYSVSFKVELYAESQNFPSKLKNMVLPYVEKKNQPDKNLLNLYYTDKLIHTDSFILTELNVNQPNRIIVI